VVILAQRTIILHYHLFKNAGTSVDKILQDNFPDRWVTAEFPPKGNDNSALVAEWIRDTPDAVAFSSHTMLGPIPKIDGVEVISVLLLRDPIARIRSAYRFERKQDAQTFGAVLAKHTDFDGYVRSRLALPNDRQCRNFQTQRLASLVPGPAPELERAKAALERIDLIGRVDAFDAFLAEMQVALEARFDGFQTGDNVHMNASKAEARQSAPAAEDTPLDRLLESVNRDDMALLEALAARGAPVPLAASD